MGDIKLSNGGVIMVGDVAVIVDEVIIEVV